MKLIVSLFIVLLLCMYTIADANRASPRKVLPREFHIPATAPKGWTTQQDEAAVSMAHHFPQKEWVEGDPITLLNYASFHQKSLQLPDDVAPPNGKARFHIMMPVSTGLGNKLEAIVSGFLLSLVTNRVMFLEWPYGTDNIFDRPSFAWDALYNAIPGQDMREDYRHWIVSYPHGTFKKGDKSTLLHVIHDELYCFDPSECRSQLMCNHLEEGKEMVIRTEMNQYLGSYLAYNLHVQDRLEEIFGEYWAMEDAINAEVSTEDIPDIQRRAERIYVTLFNYLFVAKRAVMDDVEDVYRKHFAENYVVGMQIRRQENVSPPDIVSIFWQEALRRAELRPSLQTPVVFFLATDTPSLHDMAEKILGATGKVVTYSHPPVQHLLNRRNFTEAAVDVWLLGEVDELITTCGSSFGRISYGRSGRHAITIPYQTGPGTFIKCQYGFQAHFKPTLLSTVEPCAYHVWKVMKTSRCWDTKRMEPIMDSVCRGS